jgi:hypothetical protein
MRLAFICLSVSCFALVVVLWQQVSIIGELLLVTVAIGPLGAALFAPDAITTPRHSITLAGRLHSLFGACFVVGFPIAATVIGWDLVGNQRVAPYNTIFPQCRSWSGSASSPSWDQYTFSVAPLLNLGLTY